MTLILCLIIPKVKNPIKITEYRPISLSNVVSQLASKVLANWFKILFPHIICENQSAFMSNHLITENVLVAFEIMHHMSQKRNGKVGEMALKLDMSKAYNRVEWECPEKIMLKMDFDIKLVDIMMRCVKSITYSIKINRIPQGKIIPTRGLRQGDPISSYLFFICVEGLSALLKQSVEQGLLKGVAPSTRGPKISHIFFVDDNLIFVKLLGRIVPF